MCTAERLQVTRGWPAGQASASGQLEVGRALHVLEVGVGGERLALGDQPGSGVGAQEARQDRDTRGAPARRRGGRRPRRRARRGQDRVAVEVDQRHGIGTARASDCLACSGACATDGCPSRSSRPSSSATTRSPTTCPRARWPTAGCATSASTLDLDDLLLCYGDHLGDPLLREAVAAGGDGLSPRRRARHRRCRGRAVLHRDVAARARRPRRGRAHELRHQPRDAARHRRRPRRGRPRASTTAGGSTSTGWPRACRPGSTRLHQRDPPAQPDRHDVRPAPRSRRSWRWPSATGAVLLVDETYRDLTHGDAAADGGHPVAPRRSACRRCRRPTGSRACASAGRCAATASWPRRCSPPRSRC